MRARLGAFIWLQSREGKLPRKPRSLSFRSWFPVRTRWGKKKEGADARGPVVSERGKGKGTRLLPWLGRGLLGRGEEELGRAQGEKEGSRPGARGGWASAWIPGAFSFFLFLFLKHFPK